MSEWNNSIPKVAFIGGDSRQKYAAEYIAGEGFRVELWGSEKNDGRSLDSALKGAFAVVLPLPTTTDGVRLNSESPIRLSELFEKLAHADRAPLIFGARLNEAFISEASSRGLYAIDYYDNEDLQIRNAVPTAEGAVFLAMQRLSRTIYGSRIAITGYGRIGKTLSCLLRAMGAEVTVAARRQSDLVFAEIENCSTLQIVNDKITDSLLPLCSGYDVIFNTVPCRIFDDAVISEMQKCTCLIELASAPGGFDLASIKKHELTVIHGAALPGRYAPVSAGKIIAQTLLRLFRTEGIIP